MKQTLEQQRSRVQELAEQQNKEIAEKFGDIGSAIVSEIGKVMIGGTLLLLKKSGEFNRVFARHLNELEDLMDAMEKEEA